MIEAIGISEAIVAWFGALMGVACCVDPKRRPSRRDHLVLAASLAACCTLPAVAVRMGNVSPLLVIWACAFLLGRTGWICCQMAGPEAHAHRKRIELEALCSAVGSFAMLWVAPWL